MEHSPDITFKIFHWTLVTVIFVESMMTVFHSLHSTTESHLGAILPYFAGLEAIAALLLLVPKTVKIGGAILLVIFALALIVHGPAQQTSLFVYAAGVIFLMARGYANSPEPKRSTNDDLPKE